MSSNVIEFRVADDTQVKEETSLTLVNAQAITVTDSNTYAQAGEMVRGLKALAKRITEYMADDIKRAHELHKSLTRKRAQAVDPIEAEARRLGREMAAWDAEQQRRRREEEARLAREAKAREEALALEQAALMREQGVPEAEAMAVVEQAIEAPAPVVTLAPAAPKVEGVSYRSDWRFEITDPHAIPREYLAIDEKKIGGVVRALKGAAKIPGVRVYEVKTPVVRAS